MKAKYSGKYTAKDIQVLRGNEAIRKRPKMYVGELDKPEVLTKLIIEAMCIFRAQAYEGLSSGINVSIVNDEVIISDVGGHGISHDVARGKTIIEWLFTELAGCKNVKHETIQHFCDMGIVVVNALCDFFNVSNTYDNKRYVYDFRKGKLSNQPVLLEDNDMYNGLIFNFRFDKEIFGNLKIDKDNLAKEIDKIRSDTKVEIKLI